MLKKIVRSIKKKSIIYDIKQYIFINKYFFKLFNICLPFININNRKIVFCSYYGGNYSCNPKYITEELIKQNIICELVWLVDKRKVENLFAFPKKIKLVNYLSINAFFELATAKIWIDNCRKEYFPNIKDNQYYFQTWHGNMGIKKIEKDIVNKLSARYIEDAKRDSCITSFCISNGLHISKLYKKSFWYLDTIQILEYGSPRNDILINGINLTQIKKNIGISNELKIVLYAPTFRDNYSFDSYSINYQNIIIELENKYDCKWVFLVKMHPNLILYYRDCLKVPDSVINVSLYPDIQELLSISDILISDYSSSMFDFMFTKKPCFIFATDYEDFQKKRNGVYFELDSLPFLIAKNNEQLIKNIRSFDVNIYQQKVNKFINDTGCFENGNACKMVVVKICELMEK